MELMIEETWKTVSYKQSESRGDVGFVNPLLMDRYAVSGLIRASLTEVGKGRSAKASP